MQRMPCIRRLALGMLLALFAGVLSTGCSEVLKPYAMDADFSVNVAAVRPGWPTRNERQSMTPAQEAALKEMGAPDLMYLDWNPRELIMDKSGLFMKTRNQNLRKVVAPTHWIYLESGKFVRFVSAERYKVEDMPDKLALVCEAGDPYDIDTFKGTRGSRMEKWKYYRQGVIYTFADDRKIDVDDTTIPPMPNYPRN